MTFPVSEKPNDHPYLKLLELCIYLSLYIYPRQGKCRLHKHGCIILIFFEYIVFLYFFFDDKRYVLIEAFSSFVNVISRSLCFIILVTVTV